jgi:DHA1 family tetracycline resistance protein-like MFS transporter
MLAQYGLMYPFLAAAGFNLLNFIFGLFVLPESLPQNMRRDFDLPALNPFKSLLALTRMPMVRTLVVVHFLVQIAGQTHPSIWALYTEHRFGWTAAQVGMSLAVVGILSIIAQGGLTGPAVKFFGERKLVLIGTLGEAIGFAFFGLVTTGAMAYVVLVCSSAFWSSHPALQSLISRDVPASEQGELQGSLMSLMNLASIFTPLLMTTAFSLSSDPSGSIYLPGSPYYLASFFAFVGWVIALRWYRKKPHGAV